MAILVAGGAGFIGTNFVRLLMRERECRIINFDLLTYAGCRESCAEFEGSGRYVFVQGDVADPKAVAGVLKDHAVEAIVNFAAESHVDRSIHDAAAFVRTNAMGVQTLLDAARACGVSRFVQVSTDEVYGFLGASDPPFTEATPLAPSSPYSASKAAGDFLALAAFRTHGQPVVITRCSNNYGPYQHPEKLIPLAIHRARASEPIPVYGRGENVRDWIHVEDHCRGILAALDRGRPGEAYNFGGQSERRNIEVARAILDALGKPRDLIRFVTDRPGHDFRYAIDFGKAARELGWGPKVSFEEGLASTVRWYKENGAWVQKMASPAFREFCEKHYKAL